MNSTFNGVTAVLFDFDNTLYDHDRVQAEALLQLHTEYRGIFGDTPFDQFHRQYVENNELVWKMLIAGELTRDELRLRRFGDILTQFGLKTGGARDMSDRYLAIYEGQHFFVDGAEEILDYAGGKYQLGLVTNGFSDIQRKKIDKLGIAERFDAIVMSEEVDSMKPDAKIFETVMERLDTEPDRCVFVGDNYEADVIGAENVGIPAVWFNPIGKRPPVDTPKHTAEIKHLQELKELL